MIALKFLLSAKTNAAPYPILTCRYETNISNPTWYSDDTGLELIPRQFDPSKDEPVAGKNYFLNYQRALHGNSHGDLCAHFG